MEIKHLRSSRGDSAASRGNDKITSQLHFGASSAMSCDAEGPLARSATEHKRGELEHSLDVICEWNSDLIGEVLLCVVVVDARKGCSRGGRVASEAINFLFTGLGTHMVSCALKRQFS